ncbi:unnamed protein product [Musa acuminata subsp. malaccensis]|uniref:(wild Malaysian banana) hypothetical protein n=1 Tax=Musa acuminata subsp. malaccensis TaxID=214687 RepID=A0A804JF77_MUSAM|nr:PREDICTED: uncharacterized protein LOC103987434 isoform X1 [Musa acuminata subsp. malaccensis]CAG1845973.1 unnamed protein product [Musa acuminata subsp. malaccensis]
MAHQSKFVSVNLNRSYGQPSSSTSSVYGRSRPGSGGGGSGGGGMVVLSRARSSASSAAKTGQKLAVPPPLNLPSLRKEHERFDPASSASAVGHGSAALGARAGSSALGWSKPVIPPPSSMVEKDAVGRVQAQLGRPAIGGDDMAGSPYMPPGARPGGQPINATPVPGFSEKAVVLRGEDFPSLRATFTSAPKQKEASGQKQKQHQGTVVLLEAREEASELRAPLQMRPQIRSSRLITSNVAEGDEGSIRPPGSSEQSQKQDGYLPGLLPLVRLQHTSDWTDDERDTGLSIPGRERDRGFLRPESVQARDVYDGRGLHDTEAGGTRSREFFKGGSFVKDVKAANSESQDSGSWRSPLIPRDRLNTNVLGVNRDRHYGRPSSGSRELNTEGGNGWSSFVENGDRFAKRRQDSQYARVDLVSPENIHNGRVVAETFTGRSAEQSVHGHYSIHASNWSKGSSSLNAPVSKMQFLTGSKVTPLNDPMPKFGRERRSPSSAGKPFFEDANFNSKDPFSEGIKDMNVKIFKKKKDLEKQVDFPDPVRESYEAELERILRTQEQERQRAMEEQARALELARRQEEDRERLAREEEEKRRLLEEEAREAAWIAEQETLEAARRAEEQRIAREEEKRRYQMEEERRKEAARKKLLELEARIARRQAEDKEKDDGVPSFVSASDELVPDVVKEREVPQVAEVGVWEDGERLVERITRSALSDSPLMGRFSEVGSRSQILGDSISSFVDRGKHTYGSMILPSYAEENVPRNPRQDAFGYRRGLPKKEIHGGIVSSQMPDEYHQQRKQRWNSTKEGDHFMRNIDIDAEFIDSVKFRDAAMAPNNSHESPNAPYSEISSENSMVDGFTSFTRYRQPLRQPRVLPPPHVTAVQRRDHAERANSSRFTDDEFDYDHPSRSEQKSLHAGYDSVFPETLRHPGTADFLEENAIHSVQGPEKMSPRCDSQLSLSVSSPPSSPAPLSHHEMDISRDSPPLPTSADGEHTVVSDGEHIVLPLDRGTTDRTMSSRSVSPGIDDEWPIVNSEEVQEQEEYYEEDDDYQDLAEAHEGDDENLDSAQVIEDMRTDSGEMEQVILGFNEGVEVKLPSIDKFEITRSNSKDFLAIQAGSAVSVEEPISNGEITHQGGTINNSFIIVSETERSLQILSLDPMVSSSHSTNSVEASQNPIVPAQHMMVPASNFSTASTASDSPILSLPSAAVSQGEAPISLQFGLFSGPSLIPSPVPAIKIGSIQMPIHVHTQISPSLPQVHPSQPPLFQFGQLRYAPAISKSVLPLAPHSTSFVQPPAPASYSFKQNPAGCLCYQSPHNYSSQNKSEDKMPSVSSVTQSNLAQNLIEPSQGTLSSGQLKVILDPGKNVSMASQSLVGIPSLVEKKGKNDSIYQAEHHGNDDVTVKKTYKLTGKRKESQAQQHAELQSSRFFSGGKPPLKTSSTLFGGRRKRYTYTVKNAGSRSSFAGVDTIQADPSGFQRKARRNIRRTELGVREHIERKHTLGSESFNNRTGQDKVSKDHSTANGISIKNIGRRDAALDWPTKINDSENLTSGASISRVVSYDRKTKKAIGKETALQSITSFDKSHAGKGNINTSHILEEDVDAPLLSGVVRVFKQTGIEVPSNEDDFIEVRSKRQMLNDRREQRAKENKSKSRVSKAPSKQISVSQNNAANSNSHKAEIFSVGDTPNVVCSNPSVGAGNGSTKLEPSLVFTDNMTSQTLPPIGTPLVNVDSESGLNDLKSCQVISVPAASESGLMLSPGPLDPKNINPDRTTLPLSSWGTANMSHQVIALTQTQLDKAMKPAQFRSQVVSSIVLEPHKPVLSVVTSESTVSSLLASEKIQFGAIMPPNILPPVSRAISKGLGPPDSCRSELKVGQNLPANNYSMFFVEGKCHGEPCPNLEDAEAEAEAAASAVAVAAITNDEIVGSGIAASSDTKSFTTADGTALASGDVASSQEVAAQSANEESLTDALPADLSVDTPLSVWPALPSPQTSQPLLSQFPVAAPSHFPGFEMNHILDARTFAYGSHDESTGSQGQTHQCQKAAALGSGSAGAWPQCHSGVDSLYRPTSGFNGPFISPGGIPGVQCPPQMVFYNHFAPVGQFGQVGLGFMGATYIPAGKQPDWKQNQVCSTTSDNNGNLSSLNVVSGQGTPTSVPVQNISPGSPLMAVAPPLTMFDMSPFQPTANIPLQAWSHVHPPLHSVPLTMPPQQHHVESRIPSQFNWSVSGDTATGNHRFGEAHSSVSAEISRNIPFPTYTSSEISDGLSLVKQPTSSTANIHTIKPSDSTTSGNEKKVPKMVTRTIGSGVVDSGGIGMSNSNSSGQVTGLPTQQPTSSGQQHLRPIGYADQQGGVSQRTGSGCEWHHRRTGFQARKQVTGADKNNGPPKMKQIYVAKPSINRLPNQGQTRT